MCQIHKFISAAGAATHRLMGGGLIVSIIILVSQVSGNTGLCVCSVLCFIISLNL